ncbi:DUF441 domain-containing protein [Priestia taiwanensis]|uniref:UPF0756 membrane protein GCM10007140_28220 n=1 Tax=Priestia taiwanensis TaxID=1347902 RepID=A0A917ET53_9BACI|nr:DUF441 domain-containing protein [Priestia taiwanensis]MBM7363469.1 uncharacterized membrane protein (DUF441 family) [Priestia taiwanensis]GGE76911.1 UPF0756 membrane protein [Priestia taiwanensis]
MFSEPILFLVVLLVIGFVAKNQSLMVAVAVLLVLKVTPLGDKVFPHLQSKGINWGVTVITIAVLVPIATGDIGFRQLQDALKSYYAWIAIGSGIFVAVIAKGGLNLLANDPHITAALVFGTVLAVALFNGVAVGPLIGAGIAYWIMWIVNYFK